MNVQSTQGPQFGHVKTLQGVKRDQITTLYKYLDNRAEHFDIVFINGHIHINGAGHPIKLSIEDAANPNRSVSTVKNRLDGKR